jgi:hypothetical protein
MRASPVFQMYLLSKVSYTSTLPKSHRNTPMGVCVLVYVCHGRASVVKCCLPAPRTQCSPPPERVTPHFARAGVQRGCGSGIRAQRRVLAARMGENDENRTRIKDESMPLESKTSRPLEWSST